MKWVDSTGGPLLLLPESALMLWHGHRGRSAACTDYERACGVEEIGRAHV